MLLELLFGDVPEEQHHKTVISSSLVSLEQFFGGQIILDVREKCYELQLGGSPTHLPYISAGRL
jgi:hypothetical protein